MIPLDYQIAFNMMIAIFACLTPVAVVLVLMSKVFQFFIDMVTGRDDVRL